MITSVEHRARDKAQHRHALSTVKPGAAMARRHPPPSRSRPPSGCDGIDCACLDVRPVPAWTALAASPQAQLPSLSRLEMDTIKLRRPWHRRQMHER